MADPLWERAKALFEAACELEVSDSVEELLLDVAPRRALADLAAPRVVDQDRQLVTQFEQRATDLVALDSAMERLEKRDPVMAALVDLRFFRRSNHGGVRGDLADLGAHGLSRPGHRQGLAAARGRKARRVALRREPVRALEVFVRLGNSLGSFCSL